MLLSPNLRVYSSFALLWEDLSKSNYGRSAIGTERPVLFPSTCAKIQHLEYPVFTINSKDQIILPTKIALARQCLSMRHQRDETTSLTHAESDEIQVVAVLTALLVRENLRRTNYTCCAACGQSPRHHYPVAYCDKCGWIQHPKYLSSLGKPSDGGLTATGIVVLDHIFG